MSFIRNHNYKILDIIAKNYGPGLMNGRRFYIRVYGWPSIQTASTEWFGMLETAPLVKIASVDANNIIIVFVLCCIH